MNRTVFLSFQIILLSFFSLSLHAQSDSDRDAVKRAVLDYVEALYEADSTLAYRGVSIGLAKVGVGEDSKEQDISDKRLNFERFINLVNEWNADRETDPETAAKEVVIYEILSHTASVKLVASWGVDFMHLAKYNGQWKIVNVIYQGHPSD